MCIQTMILAQSIQLIICDKKVNFHYLHNYRFQVNIIYVKLYRHRNNYIIHVCIKHFRLCGIIISTLFTDAFSRLSNAAGREMKSL